MLMNLEDLVTKHGMKVNGVLHLGAHLAEEAVEYERLNMHDVWWVEANPAVLPKIREHLRPLPRQVVLHALVYSKPNVPLNFNITNYDGMSSSILEFGTHPQFSPDTKFVDKITMSTTTIDELVHTFNVRANFLNMDLQGAELHALAGGLEFLTAQVDYVMTEVNDAEVYVGCAKIDQLDAFLWEFTRVETFWVINQGWGDALYIRSALL